MKKIFYNLFLLVSFNLLLSSANAQLTGVRTVGSGGTAGYTTLSIAIDSLNLYGAGTGGVIINLPAGYTETLSNKIINTTTGSTTNPIIITKSGSGANPLISAGVGTSTSVDGVIKIAGTDYLTIDGIDILDPATNTTNTTRMEWGYAIVKGSATNGSQHIIIRNCTVTLQKANTASKGIYTGNHIATSTTALTITNFTGTNSYIDIYSNNITNTYNGIYTNGSTLAAYYDDSLRIGTYGQNIITNFGGTSTVCYGVFAQYFKYAEIANDSINGGAATTSDVSGIYTGIAIGSTVNVKNNYIQLQASGSINSMYGVYCNSGATSGNVFIDSNRIQNGVLSGSISSNYGIYVASVPAAMNVFYNFIQTNAFTVSIGTGYGIYVSAGQGNIYNNVVSGNTVNNHFYGVYIAAGGNVYGNQVYNNITTASSAQQYGIFMTGSVGGNVYQNIVGPSSSTGSGAMQGIILAGSNVNYQAYQNKIFGLSSTSTGCVVSGIVQSGLNTSLIANNTIGILTTGSSASAANGINGINITSTSDGTISNIYHNTIYLNATSTGGSNCILINTATLATVSNNLLVNASANGTTVARAACAVKRSGTSYASYLPSSNNNYFWVSNVSTSNRFVYYDGTSSFLTLPSYQAYAANRDQSSITGTYNFLSISGASSDFLKINSAIPALVESAAKIIAGLNGDFQSSTARLSYPLVGQINGGGFLPDIGAYELDLIPADSSGPEISFTPLTKSLASVTKQLNNVSVTDASGIPLISGSLPRLYFKTSVNSNTLSASNNSLSDGWKYVETISSTSPYSFVIDYSLLYLTGAVSAGDVIQYFVVAQDNSVAHNVRVKGAALATAQSSVALTSGAFPVTVGYSYTIVNSGIVASVTIGVAGADYSSLTQSGGFFDAVNNGVITNNVDAVIISDLSNENGAVTLNKFSEDGFGIGTYTITIKPALQNNYLISGINTSAGIIKLLDVERVIFDGSYLGSGRYLFFENRATTGTNSVFHIASSGFGGGCRNIKVKNCILFTDSATNSGNNGIFIGGSTIGTGSLTTGTAGIDNKNITLSGNNIYRSYCGILVNGFAYNPTDSLNIINNIIGSDTLNNYIGYCGILMHRVNRLTISGNKIYNIINNNRSYNLYGLYSGTDIYNAEISSNNINSIINISDSTFAVHGLYIAGSSNANILLKNNIISKIIGQGGASAIAAGPVGIYINSGSNYKVLNNSVTLSGTRLNNSVGGAYTACLYLNSTVSGLNVSNNILKNVMNSINAVTAGANFAIFSNATASAFTRLNNNLYYSATATPGLVTALGYMGGILSDLSAWRNTTSLDKQSLWGDPGYVSDSLPLPNVNDTNLWNINGRGFPFSDVSKDILGTNRSITVSTGASDIGAYEVVPNTTPVDAYASAAPANGIVTYYSLGKDTVAAITWDPAGFVPVSVSVKYYSGVNPVSGTLFRYMNAYWDIQGMPNSGFNSCSVKLYYKPEAMGTVSSESSLIIAKKDPSVPWVPYTSPSTVVDSIAKTMSLGGVYNFSIYTGTDVIAPLPITLNEFTAIRSLNDVILIWNTSSEINMKSFDIERSFDGNKFEAINSLLASGNSSQTKSYSDKDENVVLSSKANLIYYRLKMIGSDGTFNYSKTVTVSVRKEMSEVRLDVYPNPAANELNLHVDTEKGGMAKIELLDGTGNKIISQNWELARGSMEVKFNNLQFLNSGIYIVRVELNGKIITKKIAKF